MPCSPARVDLPQPETRERAPRQQLDGASIVKGADDARTASKHYWNKVTDYNATVDRKDDPLPHHLMGKVSG
ncbi:hypothetical protein [Streptomyces iranensis]|uniref:RHS repeat-associated core domain-containingprotein n=1 Tax=Streptomyces iranensis TaxID=576784 RepID=A0A061A7P5_9ACTN|nr:hypothetical protein [Streptomyces iranensis]MBP2066179.1 hypothetical protein [Streptomyces iranensis]CDR13104.1 RHS repeat-associated core domain-containingprotein [Streptomyces iranensis]